MKPLSRIIAGVVFSGLVVFAFGQTSGSPREQKSDTPTTSSEQRQEKPKSQIVMGPIEVMSDSKGVDFGPYLSDILLVIKKNWYRLIPERARPPVLKKGKVVIEFAILKDGRVAGMKIASSSGDIGLDHGAWGGITASNPFPPLPSDFAGKYLALRFSFLYNEDKSDLGDVPLNPPSRSETIVTIYSPPSLRVPVGGSQTITAVAKGNTDTAVTWSVTGPGCTGLACGMMSDGLYVAPDSLPNPPLVTLKATSKADSTAWASVTIQLIQPDPNQ
jgi:TonB family protein